jgi:hypothetical protein
MYICKGKLFLKSWTKVSSFRIFHTLWFNNIIYYIVSNSRYQVMAHFNIAYKIFAILLNKWLSAILEKLKGCQMGFRPIYIHKYICTKFIYNIYIYIQYIHN